jgi:hypothetical protein
MWKRVTIAVLLCFAAGTVWAGDDRAVTGRLIGPNEKPVKGVEVAVRVKAWPGGRFQMRSHAAKSDKRGRFQVADALPAEGRYGVYVSAVAPGKTLAARYVWNGKGGPLEPVELITQPAGKLRLRFVDARGKPVAGVMAYPAMRSDAEGARHNVSLSDDGSVKSDKKGIVRMDHFLPGEWGGVHVRFPDRDWEVRNFIVSTDAGAVIDMPETAPETPDLDVAAGDDPKKRYFLMGPKAGDSEPETGYGLVLVLPGGDGGDGFTIGCASAMTIGWMPATSSPNSSRRSGTPSKRGLSCGQSSPIARRSTGSSSRPRSSSRASWRTSRDA